MTAAYRVGEFPFPQIDPARILLSADRVQPSLDNDKIDDPLRPRAGLQVSKDEGPVAAHTPRVAFHHVEVGADQRREIDLVDNEQVGARDAGSALARDLV